MPATPYGTAVYSGEDQWNDLVGVSPPPPPPPLPPAQTEGTAATDVATAAPAVAPSTAYTGDPTYNPGTDEGAYYAPAPAPADTSYDSVEASRSGTTVQPSAPAPEAAYYGPSAQQGGQIQQAATPTPSDPNAAPAAAPAATTAVAGPVSQPVAQQQDDWKGALLPTDPSVNTSITPAQAGTPATYYSSAGHYDPLSSAPPPLKPTASAGRQVDPAADAAFLWNRDLGPQLNLTPRAHQSDQSSLSYEPYPLAENVQGLFTDPTTNIAGGLAKFGGLTPQTSQYAPNDYGHQMMYNLGGSIADLTGEAAQTGWEAVQNTPGEIGSIAQGIGNVGGLVGQGLYNLATAGPDVPAPDLSGLGGAASYFGEGLKEASDADLAKKKQYAELIAGGGGWLANAFYQNQQDFNDKAAHDAGVVASLAGEYPHAWADRWGASSGPPWLSAKGEDINQGAQNAMAGVRGWTGTRYGEDPAPLLTQGWVDPRGTFGADPTAQPLLEMINTAEQAYAAGTPPPTPTNSIESGIQTLVTLDHTLGLGLTPAAIAQLTREIAAYYPQPNQDIAIPTNLATGNQDIAIPANFATGNQTIPVPTNLSDRNQTIPQPTNLSNRNQTITTPANLATGNQTIPQPTNLSNRNQTIPVPANQATGNQDIPIPTNVANGNQTIPVPTNLATGNQTIPQPTNLSNRNQDIPTPTNLSNRNQTIPQPTNLSDRNQTIPIPANGASLQPSGTIPPGAMGEATAAGKYYIDQNGNPFPPGSTTNQTIAPGTPVNDPSWLAQQGDKAKTLLEEVAASKNQVGQALAPYSTAPAIGGPTLPNVAGPDWQGALADAAQQFAENSADTTLVNGTDYGPALEAVQGANVPTPPRPSWPQIPGPSGMPEVNVQGPSLDPQAAVAAAQELLGQARGNLPDINLPDFTLPGSGVPAPPRPSWDQLPGPRGAPKPDEAALLERAKQAVAAATPEERAQWGTDQNKWAAIQGLIDGAGMTLGDAAGLVQQFNDWLPGGEIPNPADYFQDDKPTGGAPGTGGIGDVIQQVGDTIRGIIPGGQGPTFNDPRTGDQPTGTTAPATQALTPDGRLVPIPAGMSNAMPHATGEIRQKSPGLGGAQGFQVENIYEENPNGDGSINPLGSAMVGRDTFDALASQGRVSVNLTEDEWKAMAASGRLGDPNSPNSAANSEKLHKELVGHDTIIPLKWAQGIVEGVPAGGGGYITAKDALGGSTATPATPATPLSDAVLAGTGGGVSGGTAAGTAGAYYPQDTSGSSGGGYSSNGSSGGGGGYSSRGGGGGGGGSSDYYAAPSGGESGGASMWDNPIFARFMSNVETSNPSFAATLRELMQRSSSGSSGGMRRMSRRGARFGRRRSRMSGSTSSRTSSAQDSTPTTTSTSPPSSKTTSPPPIPPPPKGSPGKKKERTAV